MTGLLESEVFFLEDFFFGEFLGVAGCRGEFWGKVWRVRKELGFFSYRSYRGKGAFIEEV